MGPIHQLSVSLEGKQPSAQAAGPEGHRFESPGSTGLWALPLVSLFPLLRHRSPRCILIPIAWQDWGCGICGLWQPAVSLPSLPGLPWLQSSFLTSETAAAPNVGDGDLFTGVLELQQN